MKNENSNFVCGNGSNCIRFRIKVSKKRTTSSLCPHEHIVTILSGKNTENDASSIVETSKPSDGHEWLENTSKYLYNNRRIDLSDINIRDLEEKILEKKKYDGWPKLYHVSPNWAILR